jgi:hypothetical protein
MRRILLSLPLLSACTFVLPNFADSPDAFEVGDEPAALNASDINGDGTIDLLVVNRGSNDLTVLENDGKGVFTELNTVEVGLEPVSLFVGDLDANGTQDIAVANAGESTVSVLLSNGNGSFQPIRSFTTGADPAAVIIAEVSEDGIPDLITANRTGQISVILGLGGGDFGANTEFEAGVGLSSLLAFEFNVAPLDLMIADKSGDQVLILPNNGLGVFGAPIVMFSRAGSAPRDLVIADFDKNGLLDAASASAGLGEVAVIPALDGASAKNFSAGASPSSLALADFDGDTFLDVAFADETDPDGLFGLIFGDVNFQSPPAQFFGVGEVPGVLVTADFNGDELPDLALTEPGAGKVLISLHN